MMYLTGVNNPITAAAHRPDFGLLGTPVGGTYLQRHHYGAWAADNGCFVEQKRPGAFDTAKWLAWLAKAGPAGCLWATLPDVVGNAWATWERSAPQVAAVRALGFPVATVLQDGLEFQPGMFAEILAASDAVFIGGSTEWKLGAAAADLAAAASAAGRWVHMGRVNSYKRLAYAASIGCDSADGTYLNFGRKTDREINTRKLFGWLDRVNDHEEGAELIAA